MNRNSMGKVEVHNMTLVPIGGQSSIPPLETCPFLGGYALLEA